MSNGIREKLSAPQNTSVGRVLNHLYYFNKSLLELAPNRVGYPHNGGEHHHQQMMDIELDPSEIEEFENRFENEDFDDSDHDAWPDDDQ